MVYILVHDTRYGMNNNLLSAMIKLGTSWWCSRGASMEASREWANKRVLKDTGWEKMGAIIK